MKVYYFTQVGKCVYVCVWCVYMYVCINLHAYIHEHSILPHTVTSKKMKIPWYDGTLFTMCGKDYSLSRLDGCVNVYVCIVHACLRHIVTAITAIVIIIEGSETVLNDC